MENHISLDTHYLSPNISPDLLKQWQPVVSSCHNLLHEKQGAGNKFLGWMDAEHIVGEEELDKINREVERLRKISDTMVVIGIGGSYLGARALIEAMSADNPATRKVNFAGYQLSAHYHYRLLKELHNKEVCLNVISKSGTTLEPAIAFRILKGFMEEKYGKHPASERILATTDRHAGTLRNIADSSGYPTFGIPDDIGGRYSVLTPVGLLPIAYAGFDINKLLQGASDAAKLFSNPEIQENQAYLYAVVRNILYRQGKTIEILSNFEPALVYLGEWWKQLYGESEGKNGMGIFPSTANFTSDLHSMGQYIQEGRRDLFETFMMLKTPADSMMTISEAADNKDNLNYLAGKSLEEINYHAYAGTAQAHREGGVPNMTITIPGTDAYTLGQIVFFFEKACALSGYLLGVNPFDQPGVECYKKNMFARLKQK